MPVESYKTIEGPSTGLYREKGSKFLGFAFPVRTEAEISLHLQSIRKEYFDATHHCYAWVLGPDQKQKRMADDGEPSHSAGDPIMSAIRSRGLTNILVIVVRYFGGTKLGVGGLITAYRAAADDTLHHSVIIEKDVTTTIRIRYDYKATPEVMRLVKRFDARMVSQDFGEVPQMEILLKIANEIPFVSEVKVLSAKGHDVSIQ
ncbi:MAG: YigZ family protein [Bacteroidetes bacterium]|nr:YigZ family protein [Bacteroidota bacterium]